MDIVIIVSCRFFLIPLLGQWRRFAPHAPTGRTILRRLPNPDGNISLSETAGPSTMFRYAKSFPVPLDYAPKLSLTLPTACHALARKQDPMRQGQADA
ncbi:hypothetical protein, partial [Cupriavidus necator]|uniref:hypothetical protein n=1 Tax=Cupriavidus necator TaxID=106590 RepID=UPI0030F47A68